MNAYTICSILLWLDLSQTIALRCLDGEHIQTTLDETYASIPFESVICPADDEYNCLRIKLLFSTDDMSGNITIAQCVLKSECSSPISLCDEEYFNLETDFEFAEVALTLGSCQEMCCGLDDCNQNFVTQNVNGRSSDVSDDVIEATTRSAANRRQPSILLILMVLAAIPQSA